MGVTVRTSDLDELILDELSEGVPLRQIAREHGFSKSAFYDWRDGDKDFAGRIARARDEGHDAIADRLRRTARGKKEADGGDSTGDVQRDKLIVDTDLKLLAKWSPRYSDKFDVNASVSGTLTINVNKPV